MKHLTILLVTVFIYCGTVSAQSVSLSPSSMKLWGQTPSVAKASVQYKDFELVGLLPYRKIEHVMPTTKQSKGYSNDFNIGLFYKPFEVSKGKLSAAGGAGMFFQEFPTPQGSIVNFSLEIEYQITDIISVKYEHISNGFGIQNEFNPGVDHLSISINL